MTLERIRLWLLGRLGGIDRASAREFANRFLTPNGEAALTLTGQFESVDGKYFVSKRGKAAIAIAPWVEHATVSNCHFANDWEDVAYVDNSTGE